MSWHPFHRFVAFPFVPIGFVPIVDNSMADPHGLDMVEDWAGGMFVLWLDAPVLHPQPCEKGFPAQ